MGGPQIRWQRVDLKIARTPESPPPLPPRPPDAPPVPTLAERLAAFRAQTEARVEAYRLKHRAPAPAPAPPAPPAEELRRARTLVNLSQRELAQLLGLHRSQVAEAEVGRRRPTEAHRRWAHGRLHGLSAPEEAEEVTA